LPNREDGKSIEQAQGGSGEVVERSPSPASRRCPPERISVSARISTSVSARISTSVSTSICTASRRGIRLRGEGVIEPDIPLDAARLLSAGVTRAGNGCWYDWEDGG
jgi:hypothetical protein